MYGCFNALALYVAVLPVISVCVCVHVCVYERGREERERMSSRMKQRHKVGELYVVGILYIQLWKK